jgi:hypothetical protein
MRSGTIHRLFSLLFGSCVLENGNVFEKAAVNTTISRLAQAQPERLKNLIHDHPQFKKMLDRMFIIFFLSFSPHLFPSLNTIVDHSAWSKAVCSIRFSSGFLDG